jgi:hypothetical protein
MHEILKNKKGSIEGNIYIYEWYMGITWMIHVPWVICLGVRAKDLGIKSFK